MTADKVDILALLSSAHDCGFLNIFFITICAMHRPARLKRQLTAVALTRQTEWVDRKRISACAFVKYILNSSRLGIVASFHLPQWLIKWRESVLTRFAVVTKRLQHKTQIETIAAVGVIPLPKSACFLFKTRLHKLIAAVGVIPLPTSACLLNLATFGKSIPTLGGNWQKLISYCERRAGVTEFPTVREELV